MPGGNISADELVNVSDEEIQAVFKTFDANEDKALQYEEYLNVIRAAVSEKAEL